MNRTSLAALFVLLASALPRAGRAADQADPFAPPPDSKEPPSTEDEEAAVLGAPTRPNPNAETPPPPPHPTPPSRRPTAVRQGNDEEHSAVSQQTAPADQSGFVIELSTSGFASGSLAGGLFVGGRTASGLILGGILDYTFNSLNMPAPGGGPDVTNSTQSFRLGAGLRQSFLQSADHLVDVYGAAEVSFESRSSEFGQPAMKPSASGFSLAAGPGLRFWVHSQVAVGYLARFRLTYLSGSLGTLASTAGDVSPNGSSTQIGFDGTFQVLGVF